MNAIERILVPTDLSEFAELAMEYALLFRDRFGSRVTLLYANEPPPTMEIPEYPLGYYIDNKPESRLRVQERLRDVALAHAPEGGIETMIIDDSPSRAIIDTARRMKADVIIMGTHGRSGWKRAILGSVTEAVLRAGICPVIAVPLTRENSGS